MVSWRRAFAPTAANHECQDYKKPSAVQVKSGSRELPTSRNIGEKWGTRRTEMAHGD